MPTALDQVRDMLGKSLRILISDGRVVQGEFQCFDKDRNFILGNATEYYGLEDPVCNPIPSDRIFRTLGLAMIPGQHVVKVFLQSSNSPV